MATYEELVQDGVESTGAVSLGSFKFPSLSPKQKLARDAMRDQKSMSSATATIPEVLGPGAAPHPALRRVLPLIYAPGSAQARILKDAVQELMAIRIQGRAVVGYDPDNPEPFFDACADTSRTAQEVEQIIEDDAEASIAAEIFKLAGFYSGRIHLLTEYAKVQTQMLVIEKARRVKYLFARQQEIDLGSAPPV